MSSWKNESVGQIRECIELCKVIAKYKVHIRSTWVALYRSSDTWTGRVPNVTWEINLYQECMHVAVILLSTSQYSSPISYVWVKSFKADYLWKLLNSIESWLHLAACKSNNCTLTPKTGISEMLNIVLDHVFLYDKCYWSLVMTIIGWGSTFYLLNNWGSVVFRSGYRGVR